MRSDCIGLFWEERPVIREKKEPIKRTPPEPVWEADDYLPYIDEARAFEIPQYTDQQLLLAFVGKDAEPIVYDVESYPNYFCVAFQGVRTRRVVYFEAFGPDATLCPQQIAKLRYMLEHGLIIGFNSISYDAVIVALALAGKTTEQMNNGSNMIIQLNFRPAEVLKAFKVKKLKFNHVDIIEVAPLSGSLKIYAGRIHVKRMQDLPYDPANGLNRNQAKVVLWYCINDLIDTIELFLTLKEELELRETLTAEYNMDLRSKSDAQIAEAIIGKEWSKVTRQWPNKEFVEPDTVYYYQAPFYLHFQTDLLNWVANTFVTTPLVVGESGKIQTPPQFQKFIITVGKTNYKLGLGGIHSQEKAVTFVSNETHTIREIDVTSFYPFIILILKLFPKNLGALFLDIFGPIVYRRLDAKRSKLKKIADSLKIVINGTFGKMGSVFSIMYEPDLLVNVTFSGQLSELMLIEALELNGITVISANTDGIVALCPNDKTDLMNRLVKEWEDKTGYNMEESVYDILCKRDVNNYIGVKQELDNKGVRKTTVKGIFAEPGLSKNPTNWVCIEAVKNYLTNGTPIEETVYNHNKFTDFLTVRTVKGGGVQVEGENITYLGKAVRWYYAKDFEGVIVYAKSGNHVPRSQGARACMDLPTTTPADLDRDWYVQEAYDILENAGLPLQRPETNAQEGAAG